MSRPRLWQPLSYPAGAAAAAAAVTAAVAAAAAGGPLLAGLRPAARVVTSVPRESFQREHPAGAAPQLPAGQLAPMRTCRQHRIPEMNSGTGRSVTPPTCHPPAASDTSPFHHPRTAATATILPSRICHH